MSRIGKLESKDVGTVIIDGIMYSTEKVSKFIPTELGIPVEYDTDATGVLIFIRKQESPKINKCEFNKAYIPKQTTRGNDKSESIIKQVIFKVASELSSSFTFNDITEALDTVDEAYNKLKEKYLKELM